MDCPKKYEFSYIKKLSSRNYQRNLAYGSFVHALVEEAHLGKDLSAITEVHSTTLIGKELERYLKEYPESSLNIQKDAALALAVTKEWQKYWKERSDDLSSNSYTISQAEKEWAFRVNASIDSPIHAGKSDAILFHKTYSGSFLYELKTSGSTTKEAYKHKLELDKQINSNLIAMKMDGLSPRGVVYDIIWKPAIRLKKDETEEEFTQRTIELYQKSPQEYFERLMVFRSEKDLDDYALDLHGQYSALRGVIERGRFYRNTNACERFGKLCQFFNACMGGAPQEEIEQFVVRDKKLPELTKEIQE